MTKETSAKPKRNANCGLWIALALAFSFSIDSAAQTNTNTIGRIGPSVWRLGFIEHPNLVESSGVAASPNYPGVFWSHNDTESPHFLFALDRQGHHLGGFELKGADPIDWEAITFDESGLLYIADTGTNGLARTHSAIHRVEEPNPANRWGPAQVTATWYIRFPGEREDCEAFFIHNGFAYLLAKYPVRGRVPMYRFSLAETGNSILLEQVASVPTPGRVSDAALSRDSQQLALITSEGVTVIYIQGDPLQAGTAPRRGIEFKSAIIEGGTFIPDGLLVTGESRDVLLFTSSFISGAPIFESPLLNQTVFEGGAAEFRATVSGFPAPTFQWRFNGTLLTNQTGAVLTLTNITVANAGTYELTVSNAIGVVTSSATLTVIARILDLRITEIMSSELPGDAPTADWWELTSFDFREVDLSGWRFNDSLGGLSDAFVIPEGVTIAPGESIVFIENLTSEQFKIWWGPENFGPAAKIFTFSGAQLSFRATGDRLRLWTDEATDDEDVFARVDFGVAEFGVSFGYDPETGVFGRKSELGLNGAFRAATGADVASPNRIRNSRLTIQSSVSGGLLQLNVSGTDGETILLESTSDLSTSAWQPEGELIGNENRLPIQPGTRFYRVRRN